MLIKETLEAPELNRSVNLHIHIPNGCDANNPCPVLYFHDGDCVFEENPSRGIGSLHYNEYYKDYSQFLPKVIIVGIEPPVGRWERTAELSPYTKSFETHGADFEPTVHGKGKQLIKWIVNELKPWIDARYPVLPDQRNTAIGGMSSGALNATYAAMMYPDVFGRLLLHGPAYNLWLDKLLETAENADFSNLHRCYMDIGTNDFTRMSEKEKTMFCALRMKEEMIKKGMTPNNLKFFTIPNGEHSAETWRWTFPDAIRWVFPM